jgi:tetratricopeptide (TPR) repeat protein
VRSTTPDHLRPRPSNHPLTVVAPILAMVGLGTAIALAGGCASPIPTSTSSTPSANVVSTATFATSGPAVTAAAIAYDRMLPDEGPPVSLTASDGTGLELVRIDARAVVEGPLAFTELHLYFNNPEARVREGRFSITLPAGAALSRFAMQGADEKMMEAEVVEKMAARRAYEDFLHRRQDPALLEQAGGNEFSARVFPIPANATKHLVISYSQTIDSSTGSYVLPLRGLPAIGQIDARVRVARGDRATAAWDETVLGQKRWKPDRDMVVPIASPIAAVASGSFLAARVAIPAAGATDDKPASLAILVDTSASRALGFARQVDRVGELIAAVAKRYGAVDIAVAAFDQDVLPIYSGRADGWTADHAKALLARQPLGASNLGAAMTWAATAQRKRVVVIGDGVITAGVEKDELLAQVKALGGKGVERVDAVLLGGIRDVEAARTWVDAGLARDGAVLDLDRGADDVARRLGLPVRSDLAIRVPGATWVWPDRAAGVQPGDEIVVFANLKDPTNAKIEVGDNTTITVKPSRVTGALLARAAAQAEVLRLERDLAKATDPKQKASLRDAIVKRSTTSRVISSLTAFLVLETDADYARYNIPRNALADILVVADDGVRLEQRKAPVVIAQPEIAVGKPDKPEPKKKRITMDVVGADGAERDDFDALGEGQGEGGNEPTTLSPGASAGSGAPLAEPPAPPAPPPPPDTADGRALRQERERRPARNQSPGDDGPEEERLLARERSDDGEDDDFDKGGPPALDGRLAKIVDLIASKRTEAALLDALSWRRESPGDVLALIALGEALEARGDVALAARAYGSLIDLFPGRADLRRFAGERLERLAAAGRELAIDTYRRAVDDRPDHLSGHRLLAMALVRAGRHADAFAALERGVTQPYPGDRFRGGDRILRDDLGLVAAAWLAREPGKRADVMKRLAKHDATLATKSSLRFVLYWETDANDVDFHIRDARGGHAYYSKKELASGGELYADVTTGYGPECFTIEGPAKAAPYKLKIHYYSRGPMGYGMGVLEILRHDGKGNLSFEHRPYIAMNDRAYVDLGTVR